ncbi:hypothetical protein B4113_3404 [Geobacillus sp. B4113_201601]|nr:hypothetical protein B4113_3404 [Geobacillus sp. B4113_201601]
MNGFEHIYFTQGIGFMSPFLFGCQFVLANLLIDSRFIYIPKALRNKEANRR